MLRFFTVSLFITRQLPVTNARSLIFYFFFSIFDLVVPFCFDCIISWSLLLLLV